MPESKVRCFISLAFPSNVKQELSRIQGRFKSDCIYGRWTKNQGLHMTLAFLGNQPVSAISKIQSVMNDAVQQIPAFKLRLAKTGAFPNINNPKVLWVGLGGDTDRLTGLQKNLIVGLRQIGISLKRQKIFPHITICRIKGFGAGAKVRRVASEFDNYKGDNFFIRDIHCFESQLTSTGAVHTRLFTASLGSND